MKLNIFKIVTPIILILLGLIAVLDIFFPENHPTRFMAVYLQALVLGISLLFFFKTYISKIKISALHTSLMIFMLMLVIYGIFTPNLSILPVLLYPISFFYLAYYLTYKGYLKINLIQSLAVFLLIIYSYETYLGIIDRMEYYGEFFKRADNVGYRSLYLMLLFAIDLKRVRNIIFLSITFILVLISFKRGAMLSGTLAYVVIMWPIITGKFKISKKTRRYLLITGITAIVIIMYFVIYYWDIIIFRFIHDETGGSGRSLFWPEIVNGWNEGSLWRRIFGFGLFTVPEFLLNNSIYNVAIYAHSDWYELLYDHGLFGVFIYFVVFITAFFQRKIIYLYAKELYYAYLMCLAIWLLKSYFSGVYINKNSIILTFVLGFIVAISYRRKITKTNNNFNVQFER